MKNSNNKAIWLAADLSLAVTILLVGFFFGVIFGRHEVMSQTSVHLVVGGAMRGLYFGDCATVTIDGTKVTACATLHHDD